MVARGVPNTLGHIVRLLYAPRRGSILPGYRVIDDDTHQVFGNDKWAFVVGANCGGEVIWILIVTNDGKSRLDVCKHLSRILSRRQRTQGLEV